MKSIIESCIKIILLGLLLLICFIGCSKKSEVVAPPEPTIIEIVILAKTDSSAISNANVILYNADNNEAITRLSSDDNGICKLEEASAGNYFVNITAQGFNPVPVGNISPIPFAIVEEQTTNRIYYLDVHPNSGTTGQINGYVEPVVNGILIIAESTSRYSAVSGPDGYFVLFNLPFGTYDLFAYKAGYTATTNPQGTISHSSDVTSVNVSLSEITGSTLSGAVTFLASENSTVDISLLDRSTLSAIPGLSTFNALSGGTYSIEGIPPGDYIAWASFQNDGYVMDPDWIFKNPGALEITFTTDTSSELNFSVTGVITINSPTNPADSIYPVMTDSSIPTFTWTAYPSAKEYIIEVKDINGNIIWGGYEADGTINHPQIDSTSAVFNFDGTASSTLLPEQIYQWKVYADDDKNNAGIQTLISSSEDLLGLFQVP